MAEEEKKPKEDEVNDEQLDDVSGGVTAFGEEMPAPPKEGDLGDSYLLSQIADTKPPPEK